MATEFSKNLGVTSASGGLDTLHVSEMGPGVV
jgi:hypothetical protein